MEILFITQIINDMKHDFSGISAEAGVKVKLWPDVNSCGRQEAGSSYFTSEPDMDVRRE